MSIAIEHVSPASLKPAPYNPRTMGAEERKRLERGIAEFGLVDPIIARRSDSLVIGGHQRLASAINLGLASVPVVYLDDISDDRAAALNVLLNNPSAQGEWDLPKLTDLLSGLDANGFDATLTGFDDEELRRLLAPTGGLLTDPDEVPETPAEPITRVGDLITLGRHRLLCGDSTYAEQAAKVMGGAKADVVFTDPPYGVNVTGKGGDAIAGDISFTAIPLMFEMLGRFLAEGAWVYVCGGQSNMPLYSRLFEHHFRQLPRVAIWDKGRVAVMRHNGYHSCYEMVYFTFREGGGGRWFSERTSENADDIWRISLDPEKERQHPTQKPVALPARAIRNTCPPEGIVFDPFCGVGSTLLAAELTGRSCYAIEIAPAFCDVIVTRWENATGQTAVRPSRG